MKARIYVNRYVIGRNRKTGSDDPPISIMTSRGTEHAREIIIHGLCRIVYNRHKPLKSGAWLWMETDAEIEIIR